MFSSLRHLAVLAILAPAAVSFGANFGAVVPVRGTASDIALDERHGSLYIANFSAGRIEVMNTASRTLGNPLFVPYPPSSVAMSPDNRFLVVGEYEQFGRDPSTGGITVFDFDANQRQDVVFPDPVLAVAFGAGSQALVITTTSFLLLDPLTTKTTALPPPTPLPGGKNLPVPFATFPPNIIQASTGVSGDRQTIIIVAENAGQSTVLQYKVGDTQVNVVTITSAPPLGPIAVSVNQDGTAFVAGWILLDERLGTVTQFPYPTGDFRLGGHAWDTTRNVIYADIPATANESPVLHLVDTDNLTVRERIQLPQTIAGRSLFSSDMNTLYAVSDSGVMVLPVGSLSAAPQIGGVQEDVLFQADACNRAVISQNLDVRALPGAANADFKLSLPGGTNGIRLSQSSGTTPATIRIDVDPTAFQSAQGTTTITLNVQSSGAINLPFPVRLLINTRDENQRGRIVNVPGKIVDILADPVRNRIYMIRQDKNVVLVYDSATFTPAGGPLRTGNTPTGMAFTSDHRYLMVGNDNSQFVSVFDLETLQPALPVVLASAYPHLIAVGNGAIWATARTVGAASGSAGTSTPLYKIDFPARFASAPPALGIYTNSAPPDAALVASASGNYILLASTDGTVAMWDATSNLWGNSRQDLKSLGGAYGSFNDNLFIADNNLLDISLFPVEALETGTGASSGVGVAGGYGLRTTTAAASGPGTIERLDTTTLQLFRATPTIEAPVLASTLKTPPIGQIGETILPFTRTLAVPQDQSSIVLLTQSGLTILDPNFDAPVPIPSITSVVNSADGGAVAPGGLIQITGSGLAPFPAAAGGLPLPFALGDVCATVSNVTIPLFYVTPTTIMAELPFTVVGASPLILRTPGGISSPFNVNIQPFAPAIFHTGTAGDQTGLATVVRDSNNQLVDFTNPIHPDELISIYLTGLGVTNPAAPLGDAAPSNPLANASTPPAVTLGATNLYVTFAGLVPGEVGVYQIDALVPGGTPGAVQAPLVITQGTASTGIYVRVVNP